MHPVSRNVGMCLLVCAGLLACGGGDSTPDEPPTDLDLDYSSLRIAESSATPLVYASGDQQLLSLLRNGIRVLTATTDVVGLPTAAVNPTTLVRAPHSTTTVQVDGVDEADTVKYDGRHLFVVRSELAAPGEVRDVLSISRTDPATAAVEPVSKFVIEGQHSLLPVIYPLPAENGAAEYLLALSADYRGWVSAPGPGIGPVRLPDKTSIQLLDVRDPRHVASSWKVELDGWMLTSRLISDTLYLVIGYRLRMPDLLLPADTPEKRETNERRIRAAGIAELLPGYRDNDGVRRALVTPSQCLVTPQTAPNDAFTDVLVIAAIDMRSRRLADAACLGTNTNGLYMSRETLYLGGAQWNAPGGVPVTVLHKFALTGGGIQYRATGAVTGSVGWNNPSYFMDEHEGDLRIVTSAGSHHRLTVLRETSGQNLMVVSSLPNAARPAPIGKPGETVKAVRFVGERAYVVTFRRTDPLYVINLEDPADPAIAGELEISGFSTYLRAFGPTQSELLFAVGNETDAQGRNDGVKVQLFDVRDIAQPRLIGSEVFGRTGTWSEAEQNPHAITFLTMPEEEGVHRVALPIQVHDVPHPLSPGEFKWRYSGLHLFEISERGVTGPQLEFHGVLRTEEPSETKPAPRLQATRRGVLHDESVFAVDDERVASSLWQNVPVQ